MALIMENKIGDVSNDFINTLIKTAEELGANRKELLKKTQLTETALTEPGKRLGLVRLMKVGYEIIQMTKEPALGLISGQRSVITSLGYPGLLAMNAPNLGEALEQFCFFEPLNSRCNRGRSQLSVHNHEAELSFYSIAPYNTYNIFVVDMAISGWCSWIEWLSGKKNLITSVSFEYPEPAYFKKYQEVFPCKVYFNASSNAIYLSKNALNTPVLYHNAQLYNSLQAQCLKLQEELSLELSMGQRVQKALGPLLHNASLSIEDISNHIMIPPWTLRRRLAEEGLSFQMIVDDMRKSL
ncbi:MAG: AraC family transcriptional regulator, partial [Pseudomonadales bacterium]|nr:AraC family transcriptional regulator [Pseudomonadales bacterium]